MSFFFPPPPPFVGGAQPYAARPLNPSLEGVASSPPPFRLGGPIALIAEGVALAQPSTWPYLFLGQAQPYEGSQLAPFQTAVKVDNPPFSDASETSRVQATIVAPWQPAAWPYAFFGGWQPYTVAKLNPSITSSPINNPPFTQGGRTAGAQASVVAQAQPAAWSYEFLGSQQPYGPRVLNASLLAVIVNNPPFDRRARETMIQIVAQSQPPMWPYDFISRQPYAQAEFRVSFSYQIGRGLIIT